MRMPMNHVSMDELDALLGNRDEGLFDEEGEQYQQFLRVRFAPSSYAALNNYCEAAHSNGHFTGVVNCLDSNRASVKHAFTKHWLAHVP